MASANGALPGATPSSLKSLLAQTRKLQSTVVGVDVDESFPTVRLGLDQIESQSRRLRAKATHQDVADASDALSGPLQGVQTAHYLLAGGGINADELGRNIRAVDLKGTFEPLQPLHDADLEGYLRHEHEQSIIASVEERRRQTADEFYGMMDEVMRTEWRRQRERIFDELRRRHSGAQLAGPSTRRRDRPQHSLHEPQDLAPLGGASESAGIHGRMLRYETAVSRFNQDRREGLSCGVATGFGDACQGSPALVETWRLVASICGEREGTPTTSARRLPVARASLDPNRLARASLSHLQDQFLQHVNRQLEANPVEAALGGDPSLSNKIRAFVHLRYLTGGESERRLEIVNRTAIWARLFFLIRAGQPHEALELARQQEQHIRKVDEVFVPNFASWVSSPTRCLSKARRDQLCAEYSQRLRHDAPADPFRLALYKIVARLDLGRRSAPVAITSVEDWAWFQLMLVHDGNGLEFAPHERFTLDDFAKAVLKYGESHFDPNGTRPMTYCRMLLMSGHFEKTTSLLEQKPQYQIDAVHFSIALAYHGLLKTDEAEPAAGTNSGPAIFTRQIRRYAALLARTAPAAALQYLYLLCLDPPSVGHLAQSRLNACYDAISSLIVDAPDAGEMIGHIRDDGTCEDGLLQRNLPLLGLTSRRDLAARILKPAAERAQARKQHDQALALFHIAGDYGLVLTTLNGRLGDLLQRSSTGEAREAFARARAVLVRYGDGLDNGDPAFSSPRSTCDLLLTLEEVLRLANEGEALEALAVAQRIDFLPRGNDLVEIIRKADEAKALDRSILQNLDFIVSSVMDILLGAYRILKASPYRDAPHHLEIEAVQTRARALITWVGMMKYQLQPHTMAALSQKLVYLN